MAFESLELTQQLVQIPSETSRGNQAVTQAIADTLRKMDFEVVLFEYQDFHDLSKIALAARRRPSAGQSESQPPHGPSKPGIGFFCHSDVVSTEGWKCPHGGPWDAAVADEKLWGRGACDMKGPMACGLAAIARIPQSRQQAPIYFFVTGDEESGMAGADLLSRESEFLNEMVSAGGMGIICEPTELKTVNAHKGGCHITVTSAGIAAHSSSTDGLNANWKLIPFLEYLQQVKTRCDIEPSLRNDAFTPPELSLNVVIENEPAMPNISVGKAVCRLFLRPMPNTKWRELVDEILVRARQLGLEADCLRPLPPLDTAADRPLVKRLLNRLGQTQPASVSYATDGCCLSQVQDMIVLGPGNISQAHTPDEWIAVSQLALGTDTYEKLIGEFATQASS